jgi:hypothetical protein
MIEGDDILLKRILVPLDGSDSSFRAAKYAIKVAKMANAEIIFMHADVIQISRQRHSSLTGIYQIGKKYFNVHTRNEAKDMLYTCVIKNGAESYSFNMARILLPI